jgi:hypothetical protein
MLQALVVKVALPANGGILQKAQGSHEPQACYFRRIAVTSERLQRVELRPPLVLTDPPLSSINMEDTP